MIQKSDITARKNRRGGSIVKLTSQSFVDAQNARDADLERALGIVSVWPRLTTETLFVVVDMQDRKTWNKPDSIGVSACDASGKPINGLAYSVRIADLELVQA